MQYISKNERAFFDYHIIDRIQAGIVLSGPEVKAVRGGMVTLKGSFAFIQNNELWIHNMHISSYGPAGPQPLYEPRHTRKLLLKKQEIRRLTGKLKEKGLTLVPLGIYTNAARIKIELGIARGKRQYEKREKIKKQDIEKEIRRNLKRSMPSEG